MTFDVTEAAAPRSDQQNYEDYISGPKTVTVSEARPGNSEQPVEVHLVEYPGRPFKPSKTVLRILMAAWTKDASTWAGKRMTLYGDPTVKFGGAVVGGIRVSHLSHIDKPIKLNLTATRGKKTLHEVKPLPDEPQQHPEPTEAEVAECTDTDVLREMWQRSGDERRAQIMARKAELEQVDTTTGEVTVEEPHA